MAEILCSKNHDQVNNGRWDESKARLQRDPVLLTADEC